MQSYLEQDRYSYEYNWLVNSKSPYLEQHKTNPVNWLEWSEEAFEKARRENKPIFLSIGYSTCHWCHVMAHESFEDEEVARILNEHFISIKVDREERPDIDAIYMKACQAMTGQGGWPLSVFLTAEKKPFYVGTYFPKHSTYGRPGFIDVLVQLADQYENHREKLDHVGEQIVQALQERATSKVVLSRKTLEQAFKQFESSFDVEYGGFGEAPKFPIPHQLMFLLRYYRLTDNDKALHMVERTLDAIGNGGIYDHIGFGFARYSVDEMWLVPHFEKMLYDNALLSIAYIEAYQVTREMRFRQKAEEIFTYVLRDMQDAQGGFYSAEDADSEGVEGKFYVWTEEEVIDVLGPLLGELLCDVFDITEDGNFEGKSIPNLIKRDFLDFSVYCGMDLEKLTERMEEARKKLFEHREKRIHPHKDDKILTAWNGLMIAALAMAGRVFYDKQYTEAAKKAIRFIEEKLIVDGRLMVRYRGGDVKQAGYIDDYANVLWAYIELYETTFELGYLKKAKALAEQMIELFWDEEAGGFYFYGDDHETLFVRPKEVYDGAMPSGNSVASLQLLRLARLTGETQFEEKMNKLLGAFGSEVERYPSGYSYLLQTLCTLEYGMKEVVVLLHEKQGNEYLLEHLQQEFHPELTYLVSQDEQELTEIAPFTEDFSKVDGKTTVFICEQFACQQPTTDVEAVIKKL